VSEDPHVAKFFLTPPEESGSEAPADLEVTVYENPQGLSLEQFFDGEEWPNLFNDAVGGYEPFSAGGASGYWFDDVLGLVNYTVVALSSDGYVYQFADAQKHQADGVFVNIVQSLVSDDGATAEGPPPTETTAPLKKELDETQAKIKADQAKGVFTGELGDYFFIARPEIDPVPPELSTEPYPPGSCRFDSVPPAPADTPLYVELPPQVDGMKVTPESPPLAVRCAGEITSVQQRGKMDTPRGPGDVILAKFYVYHPRYVGSAGTSRDRYGLTEIAGEPALVVASLGYSDVSHVKVILEPYREGAPGVGLSIDADLSGPQTVALAEEIIASARGGQ
jgi:hypothetical protein